MNVKKVACSEAFKNLELPGRMQNEVVSWLHKFCREQDDCIVLYTYEGQEIKIPVDASKFIDPETGMPYTSTHALVMDITAALYGSVRVLISRADAQSHCEDSPVSGWRADPDTGESHWGYDCLDWEDSE